MTNTELRRLRRHHLRLTQVQLAAAIGVQPTTVARWEQGVKPISPLAVTALTLYAERATAPTPSISRQSTRRRRAS